MSGYFLIYRGLHEKALFRSSSPYSRFEAWVDLIEQANFAESLFRHKSQMFTIPRGSLGTSYRALAKRWTWSVDRVIREVKLWQSQLMVDLETRHGYLHLTLCNYEIYQNPHDADATPTRQERDTDATVTSTNQKKVKKERKEKNTNTPTPLPEWLPLQLWEDYLAMRRGKGAEATERAKVLIIAKLDAWRAKGHDPAQILSKSITSNWTDIYEPKGNNHENSNRHTANVSGTADSPRKFDGIGQSKWLTAAEQIIAEDKATGRWEGRK